MTPAAADSSDLPARLATLERETGRLRALTLFLGLGLLALLAWQLMPRGATLDARRIVLRDGSGRARAELGFREDGASMLRINNSAERARIMMFVRDDGAATFRMSDAQGQHRMALAIGTDGAPSLSMTGRDGRSRLLARLEGDLPELTMLDEQQQARWRAP